MTFEKWLLDNNYRSSTARKSVRDLQRLRTLFFRKQMTHTANDVVTLRRYRGYLEAVGTNEDAFDRWVRKQPLAALKVLKSKDAKPREQARSFPETEWRKLVNALAADDSPEGTVLYVQAVTGHRIGDVLRLSRKALLKGLRTGVLQLQRKGGTYVEVPVAGLPEPWEALRDRWPAAEGGTVAQWICPTSSLGEEAGGGAYQRVRRRLRSLAVELGISGRPNLHRLRRTVGVRALKKTKDIHLVSQLLGHRSLQSTEHYVTELRASEVAALQRNLLEPGADE